MTNGLGMFFLGAGIAVIVYSLNVVTHMEGAQWGWPEPLQAWHANNTGFDWYTDREAVAAFVLTWCTILVNLAVALFLLRAAILPLFQAYPELVKLIPSSAPWVWTYHPGVQNA